MLQEIKRKQSITEGLYLYLLQRREEAAISSTASQVPHYTQIDPASGHGPVEPNTTNLIMYTSLLGLCLAFGWIYIKELLNDKVTTREDIINRLGTPLLGTISHVKKNEKQNKASLARNLTGEQFRAIRTHLSFQLKNKEAKIILVTSSTIGEGKSFTSFNLASVCAMPGKRVALVEFDLRRPVLAANLHLDAVKGITDYLNGEVEALSDIIQVIKDMPTLHIYPAGTLAYNPADLLLSENIKSLFAILRQQYDYIIIDTAPVGLVSDAFILSQYSDEVIYVIRQNFTLKKQVNSLAETMATGSLQNIGLVFNDVKNKETYQYYTYGPGAKPPKKRKQVIA